LGQLYLEREQWKDASEALKSAVEKGDLNDESTTHLLLAISHYHQKQYQTSIRHLKVARRSETESIRKSANQWLLLVDRDVQALRDSQFEEEPPVEKAVEEEPAPQPDQAAQSDQAAQPDEAPQGEEVSQAP
jgi:tetratricopeptide (TPR) repeat protein